MLGISLLDIVAALEGPLCLNACLPTGSGCTRKAWCGAHNIWADAQKALAGVLASQTFERLTATATRNRARLGLGSPRESAFLTGVTVDG